MFNPVESVFNLYMQRMGQERLSRRILNDANLEDEEREDLEIRGCRWLQQEGGRRKLATWNGSTEKGGERYENIKNVYVNK